MSTPTLPRRVQHVATVHTQTPGRARATHVWQALLIWTWMRARRANSASRGSMLHRRQLCVCNVPLGTLTTIQIQLLRVISTAPTALHAVLARLRRLDRQSAPTAVQALPIRTPIPPPTARRAVLAAPLQQGRQHAAHAWQALLIWTPTLQLPA